MNFKDLRYYQRLVVEKNFSKVAQYFNVSQPTITTAVKRLEEEFGTQLILRKHNPLTITPAGKILAQQFDVILHEMAVTKNQIRLLKQEKIKLGLPPIIGSYLFPKIAPALAKQNLLSEIATTEAGSNDLLRLLNQGQLDMAFLGSLTPISEPNIVTHGLIASPFVIAVSPDHPLAGQQEVTFADLKKENFLILTWGFVHADAFQQMCRQQHVRPKVTFRSSDVNIIKQMVHQNVGISLLSKSAIEASDDLCCLKLRSKFQPKFLMSLCYNSTHYLDGKQKAFIDEINALFPPNPKLY